MVKSAALRQQSRSNLAFLFRCSDRWGQVIDGVKYVVRQLK
jgi:hypothetical protein